MTDRTAALKAARAKDSNDKRRRVLQTVKAMESAGQPIIIITTAAVATAAGVSTWLVYADGIREHLDAARQRQASDGDPPAATGTHTGRQPVTAAGLRTDLAVARHEIHRLRTDLDKLRGRLRLQLGSEIEQPDRADSSHGSPRWKPRTDNSSPNATPAQLRPTPPNAAPNNSKTNSPPPEKASDDSSEPPTDNAQAGPPGSDGRAGTAR